MEAFDVISYLDEKNIEYRTSGKNIGNGWIGIQCIFCLANGFHLGVNLAAKTYSCFRCGAKGNGVALVAEIEKVSKKQAYHITRKYLNLDAAITLKNKVTTYSEQVELKGLTKEFSLSAMEYLRKRNFDAQKLIKQYDLYYGGIVGDFKFRIVAPVYLDHQIMSLVGRDITDKSDRRYKVLSVSKSKLPIKSTLYNIDNAGRDVIIVEGIFDCWRIGDSCVATLGTKFTAEQILLLKGFRNAFILFDPEARRQAEKLSAMLQGIVSHVEIITLDKGDPAEMNQQEVLNLRKELLL